MLENKFDEVFRNKLLGHSSQVPDDMWERIRQKDKDRKPFPFWPWHIIGPALLFLGLSGAYYLAGPIKKTSTSQDNFRTPVNSGTHPGSSPNQLPAGNNPANPAEPADAVKMNMIPSLRESIHNPGTGHYRKMSPDQGSTLYQETFPIFETTLPKEPAPEKVNTDAIISLLSKKHTPGRQVHKPHRSLSSFGGNNTGGNSTHLQADSTAVSGTAKNKRAENPDSLSGLSRRALLAGTKMPVLKHNDWHLDLYISPDIPFLSINSGSPVAGQEISQRGKFSYTAGLKVSKSFTSHFTGQIGVQYSQINIRISKSDTLFSVTGDRQLSSLDIPILVGYEVGNDRFKAAINTGVILNAYSWNKGSYSTSNGNPYRQNTGTSLYLGLCFTHALSEQFSIFAEPYVKYRTSNMTNDHQPFTQKINTAGLSIGLRYNFTRNKQRK